MLVTLEVHKRWDQIYADAREKIRTLGDFSFFNSYMSQPKHQLTTFRAWAGKSSDISYYLNSHHVDFLCWALNGTVCVAFLLFFAGESIPVSSIPQESPLPSR